MPQIDMMRLTGLSFGALKPHVNAAARDTSDTSDPTSTHTLPTFAVLERWWFHMSGVEDVGHSRQTHASRFRSKKNVPVACSARQDEAGAQQPARDKQPEERQRPARLVALTPHKHLRDERQRKEMPGQSLDISLRGDVAGASALIDWSGKAFGSQI